ncbi:Uma2 family endonuclease [Mesorhizobium sp. IMUNJ 23232]|uniref:Uma2 family endonuclease n=1 Tax=Mesorhizobium sp. IMUNJ 23232 TaxID=3376064 RepID=UPI0037B6E8A0
MNIVATRAAEGFPRRSFTVAEIRRMVEAGIIAEDENFELIDGEVVPMSPKGNQHEVIKAALTEVLAARKPHDLRLGVETSLYLDERTFVEPDLCLYPKRILPEDVRGGDVLLTVEVAASSMSYDRGLKAQIYARHGVHELWVVDAGTRQTWLHRGPNPDGQWTSIERIGAGTPISPAALTDITIRMSDLD